MILAYNKYVPISRDVGNVKNYEKVSSSSSVNSIVQARFGDATENWMNFQPQFETKETFKTTTGTSFTQLGDRKDPFKLKETGLTKDQQALEEYRAKWTSSNHNFGRTYLGAPAFKKCDQ